MNLKSTLVFVSVFALSLLGPAGCDDVEGEVRETFAQYDVATNARDSNSAMAVMDPKNFERLDGLLAMARSAPRERIVLLDPFDKFEVTTMRNRLSTDQLKAFDGRAYVRHAISQGWWADEPDDPKLTLGKVNYNAPRATAPLLEDGQKTSWRMVFVRVDGQWLIDLDGLNKWYSEEILKLGRMMNKSEDAVILWLESADSGKTVTSEIWNVPPIK